MLGAWLGLIEPLWGRPSLSRLYRGYMWADPAHWGHIEPTWGQGSLPGVDKVYLGQMRSVWG